MSEQIEEKTIKVRDWPREWFHDEKFWKDVASRTVSGSLVVLLGYIAAMVLGYIGTPDGRQIMNIAVSFVLLALGIATTVWFIRNDWLPSKRRSWQYNVKWGLLLASAWIVTIMSLIAAGILVSAQS